MCAWHPTLSFFVFFFNDAATTEIYTLSLHDALPISCIQCEVVAACERAAHYRRHRHGAARSRSEEHTSELQSHSDLVCRLLLEKKNTARRAAVRIALQLTRGVARLLAERGRHRRGRS